MPDLESCTLSEGGGENKLICWRIYTIEIFLNLSEFRRLGSALKRSRSAEKCSRSFDSHDVVFLRAPWLAWSGVIAGLYPPIAPSSPNNSVTSDCVAKDGISNKSKRAPTRSRWFSWDIFRTLPMWFAYGNKIDDAHMVRCKPSKISSCNYQLLAGIGKPRMVGVKHSFTCDQSSPLILNTFHLQNVRFVSHLKTYCPYTLRFGDIDICVLPTSCLDFYI